MNLKLSRALLASLCFLVVSSRARAKTLPKAQLKFSPNPTAELQSYRNKNKPVLKSGDVIFVYENRQYRFLRKSEGALQAQNLDTGKIGTVSGIIVVKLKKNTDLSEFRKQIKFEISSEATQINRIFLKLKNLQDPPADLIELKQYPEVEKAEIEVVESEVTLK